MRQHISGPGIHHTRFELGVEKKGPATGWREGNVIQHAAKGCIERNGEVLLRCQPEIGGKLATTEVRLRMALTLGSTSFKHGDVLLWSVFAVVRIEDMGVSLNDVSDVLERNRHAGGAVRAFTRSGMERPVARWIAHPARN